ncbi:unnamed protein product [Malus baccata var. baccata]
MVDKTSVVYVIPIILLLLFSSNIVFANVSEHPKHIPDLVIADDVEKMFSRLRMQMKIIHAKKVGVPVPGRSPGVPKKAKHNN